MTIFFEDFIQLYKSNKLQMQAQIIQVAQFLTPTQQTLSFIII